jgi:hypothetical protein
MTRPGSVGGQPATSTELLAFPLPRDREQDMPDDMGQIFLGVTPAKQREALAVYLKYLRKEHGHDRVVLPCCGTFATAKAAIVAGFRPDQLECSDISLFTSIAGELFAGRDPRGLGYEVIEESPYRAEWKALDGDPYAQSALVYWIMKLCQSSDHNAFEAGFRQHWIEHRERHLEQLEESLRAFTEIYGGIRYAVRDMNDVLAEDHGDTTTVVLHPPVYSKGYAKMFDFGEHLRFEVPFEEWIADDHYARDYLDSKEKAATYIWGQLHAIPEGIPSADVMHGLVHGPARVDYWFCTKPDQFPRRMRWALDYKGGKPAEPLKGAKILPADYQITADTTLGIRAINDIQARYYRDLFAHKLGTTGTTEQFLVLLDGEVFGVIGMEHDLVYRLQDTSFFEQYAMNRAMDHHPRANRLMLLVVTCAEFRDHLAGKVRHNRAFEINSVRTTYFSPFDRVGMCQGLMNLKNRERLEDGTYKLLYSTPFHDRTFGECVTEYLRWEKEKDNG